jgi:outer membrane protein insertion porin family
MDWDGCIKYKVVERANDQIEIFRRVGSQYGVRYTRCTIRNFSAKNFFNKKAWRPLPSGDGQNLSIRAQSNGRYYQAYSASFVDHGWEGKSLTRCRFLSIIRFKPTATSRSIPPFNPCGYQEHPSDWVAG